MKIIHDNAAYSTIERLSEFVGRFVIAVEKSVLQGEVDRLGDAYFAPGYDVDPQTFFLDQLRYRPAKKRL